LEKKILAFKSSTRDSSLFSLFSLLALCSLSPSANCGRKSLDEDDYYCNKELVELLVFDAKVTNDSYQSWSFKNDAEREIIERYNATVRFVSTMSGLTRWQFIFGEVEVDYDKEFGDIYSKSLNEPWYKSAVLQHNISRESFVYSVPHHGEGIESDGYLKVTASMAIFPRDGGKEAPSAVVGFQFSHQPMYDRFMEITSSISVSNVASNFYPRRKSLVTNRNLWELMGNLGNY
jgi:voltage-dependent calcium channel alpha-2/delta-4